MENFKPTISKAPKSLSTVPKKPPAKTLEKPGKRKKRDLPASSSQKNRKPDSMGKETSLEVDMTEKVNNPSKFEKLQEPDERNQGDFPEEDREPNEGDRENGQGEPKEIAPMQPNAGDVGPLELAPIADDKEFEPILPNEGNLENGQPDNVEPDGNNVPAIAGDQEFEPILPNEGNLENEQPNNVEPDGNYVPPIAGHQGPAVGSEQGENAGDQGNGSMQSDGNEQGENAGDQGNGSIQSDGSEQGENAGDQGNGSIQPDGSEQGENAEGPVEMDNEQNKSRERDEPYAEYYLEGYCIRNEGKDQFYAVDEAGNQMYWNEPSREEPIYAYKTITVDGCEQKVEYPAKGKDNKDVYIYERGEPVYPINLDLKEVIFPVDPETNEEVYLPDARNNINYPTNRYGRMFYRKDALGNEVPIRNEYAKFTLTQTEIYPRKANRDEFYLKDEFYRREKPAKRKLDTEFEFYYAKKFNGDEFYPRTLTDVEKSN